MTQTVVPAQVGAHYSAPADRPYVDGQASCEAYSDIDGHTAAVFIEVALPEGYTLGRLTPTDAAALGSALIVAAHEASTMQRINRDKWYGPGI